jgi:hypothetical protein
MPISRRDLFLLAATRAAAEVTPEVLRYPAQVEPLVGLIERTPREKCAEMAVAQFRSGVSYRQFMGALFLAGIRNVNPRPPGFALHCVFIIHSAHLISLEAPAEIRLLPLFYALDNFKAAQERDLKAQSGDYVMRVMKGALPAADRAAADLSAAMEAWDQERAERAVVSLARNRGPADAFALLWRYGARDYRNIGHKAIYVANASRTLHAVGWQYAEPVLRSLVLSLLDFGKEQRVNGYAFEDQCWSGNLKRVRDAYPKLNAGWISAPADAAATRDILDSLRRSTPDEACGALASRLLKGEVTAASAWDAVHLAAAELAMRVRAGATIAGIHAVTSANGLRHAWIAAPDPETRFLLLLQAAGWMAQFRTLVQQREDNVRAYAITQIEPAEAAALEPTLAEIFDGIRSNTDASAARTFRLASDLAARQAFLTSAIRVTLAKADEVHYYKYLAALVEDIPLASPEWQPHLAAATVYYAKGSNDPEPAAVKRAKEALRALPV